MVEDRSLAVLGASVAFCAVGVALHRTNARFVAFHKVQSELAEKLQKSIVDNSHSLRTQLVQQETIIQKSLHPVIQSQQQLQTLEQNVGWIKDRFQNHRTRGHIGELQLEAVLKEFSRFQYDLQYSLSNNKRVDCILHSKMGKLPIDCKFPLESLLQNDQAKLKQNLQKHITDISTKYILPGETTNYAILFLPSDAIFQSVVEHTDIVLFANSKNIYLSSPTTLLCLFNQLTASTQAVEVSENNEAILQTVSKLTTDVDRLLKRFEESEKLLERTKSEFAKIQISVSKIRRHQAELESLGCQRQGAANNNNNSNSKTNSSSSGGGGAPLLTATAKVVDAPPQVTTPRQAPTTPDETAVLPAITYENDNGDENDNNDSNVPTFRRAVNGTSR